MCVCACVYVSGDAGSLSAFTCWYRRRNFVWQEFLAVSPLTRARSLGGRSRGVRCECTRWRRGTAVAAISPHDAPAFGDSSPDTIVADAAMGTSAARLSATITVSSWRDISPEIGAAIASAAMARRTIHSERVVASQREMPELADRLHFRNPTYERAFIRCWCVTLWGVLCRSLLRV